MISRQAQDLPPYFYGTEANFRLLAIVTALNGVEIAIERLKVARTPEEKHEALLCLAEAWEKVKEVMGKETNP